MVSALGIGSNVTITTPLRTQLETIEFISIFMNSILATIVCFLAILSVLLIYSLMLSDVEEKTFEFGMLRALGFSTENVVHLIICQAITFAIPGLFLGLCAANTLNAIFRYILYFLTSNYGTYQLTTGGYMVGLSLGIIMPLISNIFPI